MRLSFGLLAITSLQALFHPGSIGGGQADPDRSARQAKGQRQEGFLAAQFKAISKDFH
jgi:hypothetical protein